MNAYDPTLVTDLAEVAADALAWDWPAVPLEHIPSPAECTTDVVEAILDRLLELGWRPPERSTPPSSDEPGSPAAVVLNVTGSGTGANPDSTVWFHPPEALTYRLGPAPRTGVRAE